MKRLYTLKQAIIPFSLLLLTTFAACKKDKAKPDTEVNPGGEGNTKQTPTTNRVALTNDSLFLYAKEIYYWNQSLPSYDVFEPRKYNTFSVNRDNYAFELFNITKYSGFETVAGANYPKYSSVVDNTLSNGQQSNVNPGDANVDLNSIGYDMGFLYFQGYGDDKSYEMYVAGVYPGSPAALAGITRGAMITKINNTSIGTNYPAEAGLFDQVVRNSLTSATFSGIKADGTPFENVRLSVTKYTSSPVFKSGIVSRGGKKIGYIAYSRFAVLTNPDARNPSDSRLDPIFSNFATNGISDLVIDLRYNGGGSVQTAEYLTNLIAPSTATGVMFKETYSPILKSGNAKILVNQPFRNALGEIVKNPTTGNNYTLADLDYSDEGNTYMFKKVGNLTGVKNIVFLVTENTASASELLINNLKPHVSSIKLIGTTTYGKPVGFFPIVLENRYTVYMPNFETKNSRGEGGYYSGMVPDIKDVGTNALFDDARYDFGDTNESYLSRALTTLVPGAAPSAKIASAENNKNANTPSLNKLSPIQPIKKFNGMIEKRYNIK